MADDAGNNDEPRLFSRLFCAFDHAGEEQGMGQFVDSYHIDIDHGGFVIGRCLREM